MDIIGTFSQYRPDTPPDGMPPEMATRVLFLRDESGNDFYYLQSLLKNTPGLWVTLRPDDMIASANYDLSQIVPHDLTLARLDVFEPNPESLLGKYLNRETGLPETRAFQIVKVSSSQAKQALDDGDLLEKLGIAMPDGATLYDRLEILMAAKPWDAKTNKRVSIWYENANDWELSNPYIWAIGYEFGLTDDQIRALFNAAVNY